MNQNHRKELRVGVLFLVGVIALVVFSIMISRLNIFTDYQYLKVVFNEVSGLKKSDPVRVSGLEMGDVSRIKIRRNKTIKVILRLREPIEVFSDYRITIQELSMLGGKFVMIEPGTIGGEKVDCKKYLKGEVLVPGLSRLGEFVETHEEDVKDLFVKLRDITGKVSEGKGSLGKFINDDELYINLRESSDSLRKILRKVDTGEESAGEILAGDVYLNLKESTESLKKILKKIESGEGSIGKLVFDEQLSEQVSKAGAAAVKILEPVVKTKVFAGVGAKRYPESGATISNFYIRIEPHEARYFHIGGSVISLGEDGIIDYENEVEKDKTQTFIKADVLLGYRVLQGIGSDTFFRTGLLEGKLSAGFDLVIPVTNSSVSRVTFTLEGRDAYNSIEDEDIDENLDGSLVRGYMTVTFGKYFKFYAGGSRLFNDSEAMFGLSFEYLDEDIRNFVTLIGLSGY